MKVRGSPFKFSSHLFDTKFLCMLSVHYEPQFVDEETKTPTVLKHFFVGSQH